MRNLKTLFLLVAIPLVVYVGGCASLAPEPEQTASTMTQTPDPNAMDRRARAEARRAYRRAEEAARRAELAGQQSGVYLTSGTTVEQPMSRAQRALDVLRRSPLGTFGRWVTGGIRSLGPSQPGSSTAVPATSASPSAAAIPSVPPATALPAPTSPPGEGRIIVGRSVDTGTGIKSTVTGTPVESIPGTTPMIVRPATTGTTATAGTAAAASAPPPRTTTSTTQAAPRPATPPSDEPVVVETNPDGTPVITNTPEEPE